MKIGICGPINPLEFKELFSNYKQVPSINKGASAVNTYVRELLRQGHEVIVFTSAVPSNEPNDIVLRSSKFEIHIIHSTPGVFITHALSRLYMVRRLRKYMGPYIKQLDVLHAQWTYDFALAAKAYENDLPVFCTVRDWCPYITSIQTGLRKMQWRLYGVIFKRVMNSEKIHFIANSHYTYNQVISKYSQKQLDIIFNPIDKKLILDEKDKEINGNVFISISSSLTEGRKNIKRLLQAFQIFREKCKDAQLHLVGGGLEENTSTYKEYKSLGLLENTVILGRLNHTKLIEAIDNSTCLVHPSLEETFGNILIEGMARRIPVIGGRDSGAVPQVLENGECGILCDVLDVKSIATEMEKASDKECVEKLINKATEMLKVKYSSDSIVQKHIQLYRKYAI